MNFKNTRSIYLITVKDAGYLPEAKVLEFIGE